MLLKQLRRLRSVVPILLLLLSGVFSYPAGPIPSRLRCYVCGGENAESCGDLTSKPSQASLQECPETARGCLTQAEGKEVMRSCVDLKIKDCKTANGNSYCYCNTDACNGEPIPEPANTGDTQQDDGDDLVLRHHVNNSTNKLLMTMDIFARNQQSNRQSKCEGDDEDLCDGSGSQSEDRSDDHLIDAIFNATATEPSTSTSPATTKEDTTTNVPIEKTTRGSVEAPSEGTRTFMAVETTPNPNKEPSRGSAFTSLVPLLVAAVASVHFGNNWLLRN